jgi:hypothetical protein
MLEELIERKKRMHVSSVSIGLLAYELNRPDIAFEFFEKAFEERDTLMSFLNVFTEYDKLRPEP